MARRSGTLSAILWGGTLAGCMDITAAHIVYGYFGAVPLRLLQGIAGGILGAQAFQGGWATALLGLALHFTIAFGAAAVFVAASRSIGFLLRNAILSGALYGVAVYFFMNRVVVPLSAARKFPFSLRMMIIGVVIHIVCIGLPIALAARRFIAWRL
jgi:hypothetical protein